MRPLECSEPRIDRRQLDVELGAAVLAARQTGSFLILHVVSVCFVGRQVQFFENLSSPHFFSF